MAVGSVSTGGVAGATTAQSATTYEAGTRYSAAELRAKANPELMIANIRQDIDAAKAQIKSLTTEIEQLKAKPLTTIADLEAAQSRIASLKPRIDALNTDINFATQQINYLSGVPSSDRMAYELMFIQMQVNERQAGRR